MDIGNRSVPRWAIAALCVLIAVAVFLVVWVRDGSDEDRDDRDPLSLDEGVLDPTAAELVDLWRAGTRGRYHVRYEQSDGTTMELWRRDADVRQDLVAPGGRPVRVLRVDEATTRCDRPVGDDWSCADVDDDTDVDVLARVVGDLRGTVFEVTDDEIIGIAVRCFSSRSGGETGGELVVICLTRNGVLARLATDGERLEMVAHDDDITDDVFELPAEPTS